MEHIQITNIDIDSINITGKNNEYLDSREEGIESLIMSIKSEGLLHPIIVSLESDGTYEIIAGRRRLLSYKKIYNDSKDERYKTIPARVLSGVNDFVKDIIKLTENKERQGITKNEQDELYISLIDKYKRFVSMQEESSQMHNISIESIVKNYGLSVEKIKYLKKIINEIESLKKEGKLEDAEQIEQHLITVKDIKKTKKFMQAVREKNNKEINSKTMLTRHTQSVYLKEFLDSDNNKGKISPLLVEMLSHLPEDMQAGIIQFWVHSYMASNPTAVSPMLLCKDEDIYHQLQEKTKKKLVYNKDWLYLKEKALLSIINKTLSRIHQKHNQIWHIQTIINDIKNIIEKKVYNSNIEHAVKINFFLSVISIGFKYTVHLICKSIKDIENIQDVTNGTVRHQIEILANLLNVLMNIDNNLNSLIVRENILGKHSESVLYSIDKIKEHTKNINKLLNIDINSENAIKEISEDKIIDNLFNSVVKLSDGQYFLVDTSPESSMEILLNIYSWWLNQAIMSKNLKKRKKIIDIMYRFNLNCQEILKKELNKTSNQSEQD